MNLNKVIIAGHLTRDPELRYLPDGKAVCDVGMALNESWKDATGQKRESVTFVNVVIWGKTAEHVAQYMKKGRAMLVEGRLKQETWEDKTSGEKRSAMKVVAERVQFIGGPRDAEGVQNAPADAPQRSPADGPGAGPGPGAEDAHAGASDADSDIPF